MKKGIIIQGSSRTNGNTFQVVSAVQELTNFDVINLKDYKIAHFDYEFKNQDDDFNALFKNIAENYDVIVLATPIYWYTMSGITKVFLDRISDFLFHEKDFGRMLRGKQLASLSCGSDQEIFEGFEMPFRESANYLGMQYLGHVHTWLQDESIPENVKETLKEFSNKLIN